MAASGKIRGVLGGRFTRLRRRALLRWTRRDRVRRLDEKVSLKMDKLDELAWMGNEARSKYKYVYSDPSTGKMDPNHEEFLRISQEREGVQREIQLLLNKRQRLRGNSA